MSSERGSPRPTESHEVESLAVSPSQPTREAQRRQPHCGLWTNGPAIAWGRPHPAWPEVALSESGEGAKVGKWAASNRNDRNCCPLLCFYLHFISPQFSPHLYNALSSRRHLSLPTSPTWPTLGPLCPALLLPQLPAGENGMCGHQRAPRVGFNGM